nr:hypothetical protein [Streptomyces rubrogriseus]
MHDQPAYVRNNRMDILAANPLARALHCELFETGAEPVNTCRFVFLDPRTTRLYPDWERVAREGVGGPAGRGRQEPLRPRAVEPDR